MATVKIIGMGMSQQDLSPQQLEIVNSADILVGGQRHLDNFDRLNVTKKPISRDLEGLIEYIRAEQSTKQIVVLASGDPLFYGIGNRLIKSLGADRVDVYPNISSVAAAFARIKESWHDAAIISMHGRKSETALSEALQRKNKIAVLTDPVNSPARLAGICQKQRIADFKMCVLEKLGSEDENIGWYALDDAARKEFRDPNLVILKRIPMQNGQAESRVLQLGMPDAAYTHQAGMITKSEIRAVSLSKLCLAAGNVLWDLGAGSGSVAIEAALLIGHGRIVAIEKNPERIKDIKSNAEMFNLTNLQVVEAELPGDLSDLTAPDRVFIGGGGKKLAQIIETAAFFLKPDQSFNQVSDGFLLALNAFPHVIKKGLLFIDPDLLIFYDFYQVQGDPIVFKPVGQSVLVIYHQIGYSHFIKLLGDIADFPPAAALVHIGFGLRFQYTVKIIFQTLDIFFVSAGRG